MLDPTDIAISGYNIFSPTDSIGFNLVTVTVPPFYPKGKKKFLKNISFFDNNVFKKVDFKKSSGG
jgi:hypothetical protein